MNRTKLKLRNLIAAARHAYAPPAAEPASIPFGLAGRIAARALRQSVSWPDALERCGWWAAAVSVAICLAAFALSENLDSGAFDPFLGTEPAAENF